MRKLTALLAIGMVLGASGMAMAVQNANATANTQGVVVKPITLAVGTHLNFGRLASAATETISIAALDGARTSTGSSDIITANGSANAPSRATFAVGGEPGLTYSISGGTGTIVLASGANNLTVTLTGAYVLSAAAIGTTGTLEATAGTDTLGIGGSIPITASTPSGTYTNTGGISLTVAYN
jgi:hypothetical protein